MREKRKRLGDMLLKAGYISEDELKNALEMQKSCKGKKIGEILIDKGYVSKENILLVLQCQLGIDKINLESIEIDSRAIKLLPEALCNKYTIFPFSIIGNTIKIVMEDPLNLLAIDDVEITTGLNVKIYLATKEEILKAILKYYSNENVILAANELSKIKVEENKVELKENITDIKNAPVVKMIDYLVKSAIEDRASDIHIEPYEKIVRIRFRIDGKLVFISKLSIETLQVLVARIKILGGLNIAEKRVPQDGRILLNIEGKEIDLRVSILPTINGEKVVIRVLNRENSNMDKTDLGLNPNDLEKLNKIVTMPNGIILVTGPTGSGKSTTLYSILNSMNKENKNIVTIEEPVEYTVHGINQVNVNTATGLTFAKGLRAILRQDPDVIMIGEIRDAETAKIAIRAAITGHLVLSTLHTNDAASSLTRLIDMGIEPYLVAAAISGIVAQRLVRKICPKCKQRYKATNYEKNLLKIKENAYIFKGDGCAYCNNTGYSGRVGVYEVMEINKDIKDSILNFEKLSNIRSIAIEQLGMETLHSNCRDLVLQGVTTVEEFMSLVSYLD